MAVPVLLLTPQIHLKAVRSKEIPMQQFKKRLGPACQPSFLGAGEAAPFQYNDAVSAALPSSPGTQQQARGVPACL